MINVEWHNDSVDPEPCGSCGQVKPHQASVEIEPPNATENSFHEMLWLCSDCCEDLKRRLS